MNERHLLIITSLLTFLAPGLYGVLGALGFYTYEVLQTSGRFHFGRAALYGFLGFVIGFIVNDLSMFLIKTSYPGLLIAAGFSVKRIGSIAERFLGVTGIIK